MSTKLLPINQHPIERAIRITLGVVLLGMTVLGPRTPWGYLGIIPLVSGLLGSCPIYTLLGVSTCPARAP